jgi:hypothetical protein
MGVNGGLGDGEGRGISWHGKRSLLFLKKKKQKDFCFLAASSAVLPVALDAGCGRWRKIRDADRNQREDTRQEKLHSVLSGPVLPKPNGRERLNANTDTVFEAARDKSLFGSFSSEKEHSFVHLTKRTEKTFISAPLGDPCAQWSLTLGSGRLANRLVR